MSEEITAAFRDGAEAFNRGDLEAVVGGYAIECRYQVAREHPECRVCESREEIVAYLKEWREGIDAARIELDEVEVRGARVLTVGRFSGRSRGGRLPIEVELAILYELDPQGQVVAAEEFLDLAEARRRFAAG